MAKTMLATRLNFSMPVEMLKQTMVEMAHEFSEIPGCSWKIWLTNADRKESGGMYLFESAVQMEQFLKSKLFASVINNPEFSNFQINTFDVMEAASSIRDAPLVKIEA
jgi:hypothetical protein